MTMKSYLLINSLFKTAEYKLVNSDCLKITELSLTGSESKKVLLTSIKREDGQSIPSFVSWSILFLGCALVSLAFYFSQYSTILSSNLLNIIFFLLTITAASTLILRPVKTYTYKDTFSNKVLLKISKNSLINNATKQFVTDLNEAIENTKAKDFNRINLKKNAKIQYDIQHKNVDDLFNLGLIDEALYNRICNSMHEKVFGTITKQVINNNVIYLNR